MLATGGEIELGFILCSGTEQVGDFLLSCRPDSGMLAPLCFSAVGAAVRQRGAFKAVMTGIAEIVIQMCSPQSSSGDSSSPRKSSMPMIPSPTVTSTSSVGFPRESRISRALILRIGKYRNIYMTSWFLFKKHLLSVCPYCRKIYILIFRRIQCRLLHFISSLSGSRI